MSLEAFEVKTKKLPDGNCKLSYLYCGYCERCLYVANAWRELFPDRSIQDWQKMNYKWCKMQQNKERAERRAVDEQIEAESGTPDKEKVFRMITVNFPTGKWDLNLLLKKVEKMMKTNLYQVGNSICVFEYYSGKNPDGGNLHFHLLTGQSCKARMAITVQQLTKYLGLIGCGGSPVQIDYHRGKEEFRKKVGYILGKKKASKMKFVELDRIWRKAKGFPSFSNFFNEEYKLKYEGEILEAEAECCEFA